MKVFISADMEGTCGIVSWPETERNTPFDYSPAQKQMTREVAAACKGALAAGAEEVLVKDAHDSARNIDPMGLPRGIRMNRAWSGDLLSMMSGLNKEKFDAVFFTGYHAWASCPGNSLSHTMNGRNNKVILNGTLCSEFLMNAYTAGYFGVPVALITGDAANMVCLLAAYLARVKTAVDKTQCLPAHNTAAVLLLNGDLSAVFTIADYSSYLTFNYNQEQYQERYSRQLLCNYTAVAPWNELQHIQSR